MHALKLSVPLSDHRTRKTRSDLPSERFSQNLLHMLCSAAFDSKYRSTVP